MTYVNQRFDFSHVQEKLARLILRENRYMKGIILYKSKYGSTKQYATWLAESLQLPLKDIDKVDKKSIASYDTIFLGTSVYFAKFKIAPWLQRHIKELSIKKKIFMFVVSASSSNSGLCNHLVLTNVPTEIRDKCEFYFLPGRVLHKQLSVVDKIILKLAALYVKDLAKKKALHEDLDEVKKDNLQPLIVAAKGFLEKAA
ncbi:MAG: flavodoxin domain-containing protein [Ginsengibacter sp.]